MRYSVRIARAALLAHFLLVSLLASAQDTLAPKWTLPGQMAGGPVTYSNDGQKMLVQNVNGFAVYNGDGLRMLAAVSFRGLIASFSADGTKVYYVPYLEDSTNAIHIYEYDIANRTKTVLPNLSETNISRRITLSPDGKWLAYTSGDEYAGIYDLTTHTLRSRFTRNAAHDPLYSVDFIDSGNKVVVNGPAVFDLDGNLLYGNTARNDEFMHVSPDGTIVWSAKNGVFKVYTVSDLSLIWTAEFELDCSTMNSDGATLLTNAYGADMTSINVATGAPLPQKVVAPPGATLSPMVTPCPAGNAIIFGPTDSFGLDLYSYNSSTGAGSYIRTLQQGRSYSSLTPGTYNVGGIDIPVFRQIEKKANLQKLSTVRKASTGELLSTSSDLVRRYSSDGEYYIVPDATYSNYSKIIQSSTNTILKSIPVGIGSINWAGPHTFYSFQPTYHSVVIYTLKGGVFGIYGKGIPGTFSSVTSTADATRFVGVENGCAKVYNVADGNLIATINPISASSRINGLVFSSDRKLAVNEFDEVLGDETLRIYDCMTTTPVLLRTFTSHLPAFTWGQGTISSSGLFAAQITTGNDGPDEQSVGSVKVFRISDGQEVRSWENQFLSGGYVHSDSSSRQICFSTDDFILTWITLTGMQVSTVVPAVVTHLSFSPNSVSGGLSSTATVSLNRVANQDTVVHPYAASGLVILPSSVTIPAGSSSTTFAVGTHGASTTTTVPVSVTYNGGSVSASLTITAVSKLTLTLDRANIEGVGTCTGTITLNAPAGPGGLAVKVVSSKTSTATVSSSIATVPEDSTTATFTVTTKNPSADYLVTITAKTTKLSGSTNLMVAKLRPLVISLDKTSMTGGDTANLAITRTVAAPKGGLTYELISDSGSLIPPTQVVLPEGETTASVIVNTLPVPVNTSATITLSNGSQVKTVSAIVVPPVVTGLSSNPTDVTGNSRIDVTITFNGVTPAGFTVAGSSNAAAITVPATISIPAGQTSYVLTLAVKKVTADRTVIITIGGKTVTITLHAP